MMNRVTTPRRTFNNTMPRAALMGTLCLLALLTVLCLTGCGATAGANTSAAAHAASQAQPPASSHVNSVLGDSMPGMVMPDEATPGVGNAGKGSADTQPSSGQQSGDGTETVVQATLVEWAIQLSRSEVPAGKVRFVVTNGGTMPHNLTVQDSSGVIGNTPNFRPAQGPQTLEVDLKPGTYTLVCTLPGHAKKGQVTTLVVK
jgi:plastocyanin